MISRQDIAVNRVWEIDTPVDAPVGKSRKIILDVGLQGFHCRIVDHWMKYMDSKDESGYPVSIECRHEIFRTGFFYHEEKSYTCNSSEVAEVKNLLRVVEENADSRGWVMNLFERLALIPCIEAGGSWLKKYTPHFYDDQEKTVLERRSLVVSDVLEN